VKTLTEHDVRDTLARVMDPEIPTASIADLGMIERIGLSGDAIEIDLLPTFAGCPALDVIRSDVERAIAELAPGRRTRVRFVLDPPWTTERVNDAGRASLSEFGIAPPVLRIGRKPRAVACPFCGATTTLEESAFGPTPCRTIRYCPSCRNPFEGFKTK
jgi:ring-1,2-phenylacetyl-CoA epoxidase subunit PaaD